MLQHLIMLAFILHTGTGTGSVGLLSGIVSMVAGKGKLLHRSAGNVIFVSMLVMATFAIYLGFVRPDQLVNVFIGALVFYLVATAWQTIRGKAGTIGLFEMRIGCRTRVVYALPGSEL